MKSNKIISCLVILVAVFAIALFVDNKLLPFLLPVVFAHCDTMDGPVIMDAKTALEKGDVTAVLKWVKKDKEAKIKEAFDKALGQREISSKDKNRADMEFFETLVRIHREGEGAFFTGLKPAGEVEPGIAMADKAIDDGSADKLIDSLTQEVSTGIRKRFAEVIEKRKNKDESVEAGREFVEAYVEFIHYVERLYQNVGGKALHHGQADRNKISHVQIRAGVENGLSKQFK